MPNEKKDEMERMLFNYETTYKTSYRYGQIKCYEQTVYKEKDKKKSIHGDYQLKDSQTLTNWRNRISLNAFMKAKDIVRTNPRDEQKVYEKVTEPEQDRFQSQMTRPRLVMTPAVSMDDVTDVSARSILVGDMYTSCARKAQLETAKEYFSVQSPFIGHPTPCDAISLRKVRPLYVSPEWRMDSVKWDRRQLRTNVDATKEFWLTRKTKQDEKRRE